MLSDIVYNLSCKNKHIYVILNAIVIGCVVIDIINKWRKRIWNM